jgi:DHA2 family methylenomycin A resistance protein-like MFS transporter
MVMTESPRDTRILLVTMCAGYFLVLLDVTAMNVALPRLGAELHAEGALLAWVVTGYSVPFASLLLVGGTTGDRVGHRPVVLAGLAVFGVASLGCALAPGAGWLVGARAAQGVGAALLLPGTLAVITRAYPDDRARARAIGAWAAIGGLALPAGPVLGGVLVSAAGWRSVFWLNLPIVAAALLVAARVLPREPGDRSRRPDLVGTALGSAGLALLVAGVAERMWALAAAAVPVGVLFVLVERQRTEPVLPLRLFRDRPFSLPNLGGVVMNASSLGMLFLLTQFLQGVWRFDPLHAGLAMVPAELPLVAVPPLAARLVAGFGPARVATIALGITGAGIALLAAGSSYLTLLPALIIWGMGLGVLTPALVSGAVSAVPGSLAGLASAVNNTARQSGGALGTAACAALAGPVSAAGFVRGFHLSALVMGGVCAAMALATGLLSPARTAGAATRTPPRTAAASPAGPSGRHARAAADPCP